MLGTSVSGIITSCGNDDDDGIIYAGDGKLEDGIYPSGCLGYSRNNQGWLKYDPSAAKKLLKEAGYPDGFEMELALDSEAAGRTWGWKEQLPGPCLLPSIAGLGWAPPTHLFGGRSQRNFR